MRGTSGSLIGPLLTPTRRAREYLESPFPETQEAADTEKAGDGKLSDHELITLVAQGGTNAQIAAELNISLHTVRSHLDRIKDKTGCRRRADLTRLAIREGLV